MAQWLYLIHPPREDFIATITPEEAEIMQDGHSAYLARLHAEGILILAGPTWGQPSNDGIAVIEAPDRVAAEAIMNTDPAVASGLMTPELREMRVAFLRGRDD